MRAALVRGRARAVALVSVVCAIAGWCAGPAFAASSSISVADATAAAEQAVPVDLTFSGTNGQSSSADVEAVVRPAGGLGCQSSYQDDVSAVGGEDVALFAPGAESVAASGPYSVQTSYKPPAPGSYQVCAWLEQSQGGVEQVVPGVAPGTVSFTARSPQVTQFSVSTAKNLMPGISFQISYTTQTDQPLSLFSIIEKTGGLPCATSDELQIAQHQPEANPFADTATPMVFGGPTTTTALTTEPTGTYLICSWLEGPNPGEVDSGPLTTAITVGTPTPPPAPRPRLSLRRVAASARHGAHLSGTAARRFGGPVQVTVACGSSRAHRRTAVRHGRFSVRLRLPRGCTAGRRATVTVSWSGSAAWANQSVTRSVTVRR